MINRDNTQKTISDLKIKHYLSNNKGLDMDNVLTNAHKHLIRMYEHRSDIDDIIPTLKHQELIENINNLITKDIALSEINTFKQNMDVFSKIEQSGIHTSNGLEYTKYNLFTRTGRPSNSNNGINYAALNKDDGSRNRFISRFPGGVLLEMDYDAYHLRLISNLVDYDTPSESFHKHLGKIYFDVDNLTNDQYEESKKITFRILYGGIPKEFEEIEFFSKTKDLIDRLWKDYNRDGYIETPIFKRKLYADNFDNMNKQKIFNYMIQAYETESNIIILKNIINTLSESDSKMILYTYDSFLFDISPSDGKQIMKKLKDVMKYPVSVKIGKNYGDMMNYTG